jgi:Helix-turn-helix of DDE superfamily endonuclease
MPQQSKFEKLSSLKPAQFKRLTGVRRETFGVMVTILRKAEKAKRRRGGVASKLSVEDRLLMALEYLREYRTYFHVAQNYGVSEGYAFKVCRWVEDALIHDKRFALPGRKALLKSDMEYEVILVDASESPVERPKKDSGATTQAKRNAIPSKHSLSSTSKASK